MKTVKLQLEQLEERLVPAGGGGIESVTLEVTFQANRTVVLSGMGYKRRNGRMP